jgi:hypothetical protein
MKTQNDYLNLADDILGDVGDGAIWAFAEELAEKDGEDLYSLPIEDANGNLVE